MPARVNAYGVYAQDAWQPTNRVTVNGGMRLDWNRGGGPEEIVFKTATTSPRVGVAFDLRGEHRSVLKASYGRYAEALLATYFLQAIPGNRDTVYYDDTGPTLVEVERDPTERLYPIDPQIRQPRIDEVFGGFEQALSAHTRLSLGVMWRRNTNFLDTVFPDARFVLVQVPSALTGQPLTLYRWDNRAQAEANPLITNVDGFTFRAPTGQEIDRVHAFRDYRALTAVLNRRFATGWQTQASYVLSRARGTVDNALGAGIGFSGQFVTPTTALVNADGRLTNDFTHEFKVLASGIIPRIQVGVGAFLRALSGQTYTPVQRIPGSTLNVAAPANVRIEPRGSRRLPWQNTFDVRLEKILRRDNGGWGRVGVYADIDNIFNRGAALAIQTRVPSVRIIGVENTVPFGAPTIIQPPRQMIFGVRLSR